MIGASLVAKVVELMLPAVIADKISKQNTRRKTAKLFKELYSILDSLLDVSQAVYHTACQSEEDSNPLWIYQELSQKSKIIDSCSTRLISSVSKLNELLEIYDESLLNDLNWIIAIKGSIIYKFPEMLKIAIDGNKINRISVKFPNESLSRQILYKVREGKEYPDWPTSMINTEVRDRLKEVNINEDDQNAQFALWGQQYYADRAHVDSLFIQKFYEGWDIQLALDLKDFLETHIVVVEDTLKSLKKFLIHNFTIDEMY